jgi:hypothetical protein
LIVSLEASRKRLATRLIGRLSIQGAPPGGDNARGWRACLPRRKRSKQPGKRRGFALMRCGALPLKSYVHDPALAEQGEGLVKTEETGC